MYIRVGSIPFWTFIVFLILKLTDAISWSWWWVTSPLWISAMAVAAIFIVVLLISFGVAISDGISDKRR
jgi:Transmembrane Fragile-X-F protein